MKTSSLLVAASVLAFGAAANASSFSYSISSGSGSNNFAADATFTFTSNGDNTTTLDIQLQNTGTGANTGSGWLTGLFFDLAGSPTLNYAGLGGDSSDGYNDLVDWQLNAGTTEDWASLTAASYWALEDDASSYLDGSGSSPDVGGQEFALYAAGHFNLPGSASSAPFVSGENIGGQDGGIVNSNTQINNANHAPYVLDGLWVSFTIDGDYAADENSLSNLWFQYGTSASQPGFAVVTAPVPPAAWAGGIGLIAAGIMRRRMAS